MPSPPVVDTTLDEHVVIIGAGIAGLLTAAALSNSYSRVTVIDRDTLPTDPAPRRGVPQARQPHALLARGIQEMESLLPGFSSELTAAGAPSGDPQLDVHWYIAGHQLRPGRSGLVGYGASRPLVEFLVRQRVEALPSVQILSAHDVSGLVASQDGKRITGVLVMPRAEGATESTLAADLVVDATGRASRSPRWLQDLGYPKPAEEQIRVDITYVNRHYRRLPHHLDGRLGASVNFHPGQLHGGAVVAQEDNQFSLSIRGILGADPPVDDDGMFAWAQSLASPDIAAIVGDAEPLDTPVKMRFPANIRNRYERMPKFPNGYLVIGDAICVFNPIYGQGMTVAALEATLLRRLVSESRQLLAQRFFTAAAKVIDTPWTVAVANDLRFPQVVGRRPRSGQLINRYMDRFHAAAVYDPRLGTALLRVANMIDPPTRLLAPSQLLRTLRPRLNRPQ